MIRQASNTMGRLWAMVRNLANCSNVKRVNRFSSLKKTGTGTFHAKHVEMQSQHEVVPNHVGDCMTVRQVAKVFWAI